jgi:hypothetical protein
MREVLTARLAFKTERRSKSCEFNTGRRYSAPLLRTGRSLVPVAFRDRISRRFVETAVDRLKLQCEGFHDAPFARSDRRVAWAWEALPKVLNLQGNDEFRRDYCGALVKFRAYGDVSNEFGWTVRSRRQFSLRKFGFTSAWHAFHVCNGVEGKRECEVTGLDDYNIHWAEAPIRIFHR